MESVEGMLIIACFGFACLFVCLAYFSPYLSLTGKHSCFIWGLLFSRDVALFLHLHLEQVQNVLCTDWHSKDGGSNRCSFLSFSSQPQWFSIWPLQCNLLTGATQLVCVFSVRQDLKKKEFRCTLNLFQKDTCQRSSSKRNYSTKVCRRNQIAFIWIFEVIFRSMCDYTRTCICVVVVMLLQCCDHPDLEKHRHREAEALCAVTGGGNPSSRRWASLSQATVSLCQKHRPPPHTPPVEPHRCCGMPLLQDEDRHQSRVHCTPQRNHFWIICRLLASHLSAASRTLSSESSLIRLTIHFTRLLKAYVTSINVLWLHFINRDTDHNNTHTNQSCELVRITWLSRFYLSIDLSIYLSNPRHWM